MLVTQNSLQELCHTKLILKAIVMNDESASLDNRGHFTAKWLPFVPCQKGAEK
jgi:hypothetical protein